MHFIIILLALYSCSQPAKPVTARLLAADTTRIDTSRYSVLPFNAGRDGFIFPKESKAANLSAKEVSQIEQIINENVTGYNKANSNHKINNPDKYYKQIIAATNTNRQKEVWVNCFCTAYEKRYWRKGIIMILDGGPCFFNIKINLSTGVAYEFKVNGSS